MNKEQILNLVKRLAMSQGMYGRLLEEIQKDESMLEFLESKNFGDEIDFIMFYEGGC